MLKLRALLCLLTTLTIVTFGVVNTQSASAHVSSSTSNTFISFSTFLNDVEHANYQVYTAQGHTRIVQSEHAFQEMRSYILNMYAGVQPVSSYILDGQYFDCIATNSQPTARQLHITKLASPPHLSTIPTQQQDIYTTTANVSPLMLGKKDAFGHAIACADGTIPMERITLERLSQFPTLHDFLAKGPNGEGKPAKTTQPGGPHRYAVGYQNVDNYGGNSWLNLWNPSGDFSLSQEWYVGGSGSSLQTVEGGWVHYVPKFGAKSVLFIFATPDDYTHGCYNLDCPGFMQVNKNWALGSSFNNYSTYGGTQWGFSLQWQFYQGNWWLLLQGGGNYDAVGYYPGSIYNNGQMATNAQTAEYGGETYTDGTNWPQMGSGKFASEGWQQAAFQKSAFYIDTNHAGVWTSLSLIEPNPACYTINITPHTRGGSWGTYFYFGGVGGNC